MSFPPLPGDRPTERNASSRARTVFTLYHKLQSVIWPIGQLGICTSPKAYVVGNCLFGAVDLPYRCTKPAGVTTTSLPRANALQRLLPLTPAESVRSLAESVAIRRRRFAHVLLVSALLLCCAGTMTVPARASGTLSFSPTYISFGSVTEGTSKTVAVTITNTGPGNVSFSKASLVANDFSMSGIALPLTLSPRAHVIVYVKFAPLQATSYSGHILIESNATNSLVNYTISGSGILGTLVPTPSSANFGDVPEGTTNSQTIQLKNTGTTTETISGATLSASEFKSSCSLAYPIHLAAGASVNCTVKFTSSFTGSVTGSITFSSTATDKSLVVPLSATGVTATRSLSVTPTSLNFGNVIDGKSETLAVSLKNTGNSSVNVSGISVTGGNMTTSGGVSGATISPGQTATLDVTFAPTTVETVSGSVSVISNATNSPAKISLAAAGISSASHSATLSWNASTSSGIAGYCVYRAPKGSTTYARLNSAAISSTKYVDNSVVAGDTYSYAVTAVDTSGVESSYSSKVSVTIP